MEKLLNITISPHRRNEQTTQKIMLDVIIALLPTTIWGIYLFKTNALITVIVSILSCVGFELLYNKIMKQKISIYDLSAVVSGLLLALNLSPTIPFWIVIIGSFFAIIVIKMLFGGIGYNIVNPVLGARCFLLISFTARMTNFVYDSTTQPTPLAKLKMDETLNFVDLFLGYKAGTIGEVSILALLLGVIYLLFKKVITLRIPLAYIFTFIILITLIGQKPFNIEFTILQLCSGGIILGAFYMATDYTTSPVTPFGEILFGVILGILTALFRGPNAEGVSYAIIIGNLLVPLIEKITIPRPFGMRRK